MSHFFEEIISSLDPNIPSGVILLAVSGGVDSVVMLDHFVQSGLKCAVAHCNFGLRGAESDGDEAFVRQLASTHHLPFFVKKMDTLQYAEENGISVQMAARDLRYQWFETLVAEHGFTALATAHHLNDNLETVLLNWGRGAGLRGLSGMSAVSCRASGMIVLRPLLMDKKSEILAYARANDLQWREDSSNGKSDYTRNFLRQNVVPEWEKVQPGLLETAGKNISHLAGTYQNYRLMLEQFLPLKRVDEHLFSLEIAVLQRLPAPTEALWEILSEYGFTPEQCRQIALKTADTGTEFMSRQEAKLTIDRKYILLQLKQNQSLAPGLKIEHNDLMVRLDARSRLFLMPAEKPIVFPDGKTEIVLNADLLKFPLLLRNWAPGDAFQPFGMAGKSKKIQDYLTDLKVSRPEKEQTKVLVNADGAIIWLVGWRPDHRFRVQDSNMRLIKMKLEQV